MTGPEYAERFARRFLTCGADVLLDAAVIEVHRDKGVVFTSPGTGIGRVRARAVVFAMGCRERTRGNIRIPGNRPAGVYTAGTAQRLINIEGRMIGRRIVVVGSGDIGLIMARRCVVEGASVEAVIEKLPFPGGLNRNVVQCLGDFHIPLHLLHELTYIEGKRRVSGVRFSPVDVSADGQNSREELRIECDTVLISAGLIPEIELLRPIELPIDPLTKGPAVDQRMHTELDGFFAAGNLVQVYDLVDWVSLDGLKAGRNAAAHAMGKGGAAGRPIRIIGGEGIRSVVPQLYRPYADGSEAKVELYLRVSGVLERPVFRFSAGGEVVGEIKRPHAAPSEMVVCEVARFIDEALGRGPLRVDALQRGAARDSAGPSPAKAPEPLLAASRSVRGGKEDAVVTCVLCPDSCVVRVSSLGGETLAEGARCQRGVKYSIKEAIDPRRTFTSSVRVEGGEIAVCSVRTSKPLRRDDWRQARELAAEVALKAPVRCGQTVAEDFLEKGVALVATKSVVGKTRPDNPIQERSMP
jgi:CxxC motif-containing protein/NADPH-dependent 2,4-dienoyl-CoA reductase/sulfur reductase-like enzyme